MVTGPIMDPALFRVTAFPSAMDPLARADNQPAASAPTGQEDVPATPVTDLPPGPVKEPPQSGPHYHFQRNARSADSEAGLFALRGCPSSDDDVEEGPAPASPGRPSTATPLFQWDSTAEIVLTNAETSAGPQPAGPGATATASRMRTLIDQAYGGYTPRRGLMLDMVL